MSRIVLAVALALTTASAATAGGFRAVGAELGQWQWARDAQQHVPLPAARLTIENGPATFSRDGYVVSIPFDTAKNRRLGWTPLAEQGLFLHELGHAFDFANMTPTRRTVFKQLIGTSCAWRASVCPTDRYGSTINVPVEERFAEEYAACALGLTQLGYQAAGYNTYGWLPPAGTDAQLCALIAT